MLRNEAEGTSDFQFPHGGESDAEAGEQEPHQLRLFIVDDETLLVDLLSRHLEQHPRIQVVGAAAKGVEALAKLEALTPDVVLLDMRLGDLDGFDVLREARRLLPEARIVLFTSYYQEDALYRAFRLGASAYLSKEAGLDAITQAILTTHENKSLLDPKATTGLLRRGRRHKPPADLDPAASPRLAQLTEREYEILQFVADGLSNAQVAERLVISEYTVKTHISNLFRKLGINDRVQAVIFALEHGLR